MKLKQSLNDSVSGRKKIEIKSWQNILVFF